MADTPQEPADGDALPVRFRVSRAVVAVLALGAAVASLSAGRRLGAGAVAAPGLYVSIAMALLCLLLVVRWLVYRVDMDADGVRVRALRGAVRWGWDEVTRLGLDRQGAPRLVVRAGASSRRLPAWALTVRQAGAAAVPEQVLRQIGRQLGVPVVVRDVDGRVRRSDRQPPPAGN